MTKAPNHLRLVQRVGGHLHTAHGRHLLVHGRELVLVHLDLERRRFAFVCLEGVFVQFHFKRLGRVRGRFVQGGRVCSGLDVPVQRLKEKKNDVRKLRW